MKVKAKSINQNAEMTLPSKPSDVGDNNVRMELGGERDDFMKCIFRSNFCSLRLNILHMVW